jgi:hypothetical protein
LATATEAGSYEVSANVTMMPSEDLNRFDADKRHACIDV